MPGMCDGLRVIEVSQGMAGGLAGMILADAGAEVIKVEPPSGDRTRAQPAWIMWNRGKKSVVLDLKTSEGRAGVRDLAATADLLIAAVHTGAAGRLGIDYETLSQANPGLVHCSITGFGPIKRWSHIKGWDAVVNAKTGRARAFDKQVQKDGPAFAAIPAASYGAAMYAITGSMAALHARERTGRGQKVETSLAQAILAYDWMWLQWQMDRKPNQPTRPPGGSPTAQYFVGRTKDGKWIQCANAMSHLFVNFLLALDLGDLLGEERYANVPQIPAGPDLEELYEKLHERMQTKTADEWMDLFINQYDVAAEPFMTAQDAFDHPQITHNGNWIEVTDPAVGKTRQLGPLVKCSETPMGPQGPAPALGEHTAALLSAAKAAGTKAAAVNGASSPRYPLQGLKVVEFATFFAGPFGTAILADLGAEVIKFESLDGDTFRRFAAGAAKAMQGKKSMAVDLKKPEGREIAYEYIKRADLLMHNFRPGVPERLGIDYETCRNLNPGLVYLYAASYGSSGPMAHRAAMHPIPGAICGGALHQAGRGVPPDPDTPMSYPELREMSSRLFQANEGNPDVTSALAVAAALSMGLRSRERTGKGQYLETTMVGSCLYAESEDFIQYEGKPERRLPDRDLNGIHALYRSYRAADGWVFLACVTEREWAGLCEGLGRADLAGDARFSSPDTRLEHDDDLAAELAGIFVSRPANAWESLLAEHGVACAEVFDGDLPTFANEQPVLKEAGLWVKTSHPSLDDYNRFGPYVRFSEMENRIAPTIFVGEHTHELMRAIGYSDEKIRELTEAKVVTSSTRMADPDAD